MLPANDTEPMTMLKTLGNTSAKGGCTPNFSSSATATSAAAPPPTPLKRATICGMAVMRTMRAPTVPISVPITSPTAVISKPACVKWRSGTVAPSAITMPAAAVKLPLRAPLGELSCFRPRMNSTAAKRYASAITTVTARAFDERFGGQAAQMLGAAEHRSERAPPGLPAPWLRGGDEERSSQQRRWAAWAPKIRRRSLAGTVESFLGLGRSRCLRWLAALEHLEHAVGDHEPADDVGRGEGHRDQTEDDRHR